MELIHFLAFHKVNKNGVNGASFIKPFKDVYDKVWDQPWRGSYIQVNANGKDLTKDPQYAVLDIIDIPPQFYWSFAMYLAFKIDGAWYPIGGISFGDDRLAYQDYAKEVQKIMAKAPQKLTEIQYQKYLERLQQGNQSPPPEKESGFNKAWLAAGLPFLFIPANSKNMTKKTKKNLMIGGVVAAGAIGAYFYYKKQIIERISTLQKTIKITRGTPKWAIYNQELQQLQERLDKYFFM